MQSRDISYPSDIHQSSNFLGHTVRRQFANAMIYGIKVNL